MFVKDYMIVDPRTIGEEMSVSEALGIMEENHFHRLPVVDGSHKLIGLITEGVINDNSGRDKTSLSIFELNYLLTRTKVSDMMIRKVYTIGPDDLLVTAADLMKNKGVNVLPVVDESNHVVGIITEGDIFKAFMDILGYYKEGIRFTVPVEDRVGVMEKVCALFREENKNIESIAVYRSVRGTELIIFADSDSEGMDRVLENAGYSVVNVIHQDGKSI